MDKKKTLKKQKKVLEDTQPIMELKLKSGVKIHRNNPVEVLLDQNLIAKAIWECFSNRDTEGFIEVLETFFEAVHLAKSKKGCSYKFKNHNPSLKTLTKVISDHT